MALRLRLLLVLAVAATIAPTIATAQQGLPGRAPVQPQQPGAAAPPQMQQQIPLLPRQPQAPAAGQMPPPPVPMVPFVLTPAEEAQVDALLKAWEYHSGTIKTFECTFKKFEYDANWAAPPNFLKSMTEGELKFAKPDKGSYRITKAFENGKPVDAKEGEHWVCDGKSIFMKDYSNKQVKEYKLPPNLQGEAISDGPMPFVFGVQKDKLKARYWIRFSASPPVAGQVSLEAFPKHARDAAEFKQLDIHLTDNDLTPKAMQIHKPNSHSNFKVTDVYVIENVTKNAIVSRIQDWVTGNFVAIPTPFSWKHVVEDPSGGQAVAEAPKAPAALPPR